MVKVALINPPFLKGVYRHQPGIPIGLAYLAAVLEGNGHEVKVLDCPPLGMSHEQIKPQIAALKPDIVGITCMTPLVESVVSTARAVKDVNPETVVVLGGPHATFMDENIIRETPCVDVVIRGEGEQTLLELVQNVAALEGLQKIAGITFRKEDAVIRTGDRAFIEELDELPYPDLKCLPLEKYRLLGKMRLPILTSRGCPFQCSFCITSRVFGKKVRMRRPEKVVNELEWLKNELRAEAFGFFDDTFTFDKKRVHEICDEIIKRNINLPWDCNTRVDQISKDLLGHMKRAGCRLVALGIESGCQEILDAMNKRTTMDQNKRAIEWVKEAGMSVALTIVIGYPGETLERLKMTFDFVKKAKPDEAYICVATPYPGTELYSLVRKLGWKMSDDWSRYDTMKPVFENPALPDVKIEELRNEFYSSFYSPTYIFRETLKRNIYSTMFARSALNHIFWRVRNRLLGPELVYPD